MKGYFLMWNFDKQSVHFTMLGQHLFYYHETKDTILIHQL